MSDQYAVIGADLLKQRILDTFEAEYKILKLGQSYTLDTSTSKRTFTAENINELREYRAQLQNEYYNANGVGGVVAGF